MTLRHELDGTFLRMPSGIDRPVAVSMDAVDLQPVSSCGASSFAPFEHDSLSTWPEYWAERVKQTHKSFMHVSRQITSISHSVQQGADNHVSRQVFEAGRIRASSRPFDRGRARAQYTDLWAERLPGLWICRSE